MAWVPIFGGLGDLVGAVVKYLNWVIIGYTYI